MGNLRKHLAKPESHFDINLAPMLDVIVAIVPMLLMSVVFIRVNMIETQIPQLVAQAIEKNKNEDPKVTLALIIGQKNMKFQVVDHGKKRDIVIPLSEEKADLEKIYKEAFQLKSQYSDIFKIEIKPEGDVPLEKIVKVLDQIRKSKVEDGTFALKAEDQTVVQTNLMFPEVVFSDVFGGT